MFPKGNDFALGSLMNLEGAKELHKSYVTSLALNPYLAGFLHSWLVSLIFLHTFHAEVSHKTMTCNMRELYATCDFLLLFVRRNRDSEGRTALGAAYNRHMGWSRPRHAPSQPTGAIGGQGADPLTQGLLRPVVSATSVGTSTLGKTINPKILLRYQR